MIISSCHVAPDVKDKSTVLLYFDLGISYLVGGGMGNFVVFLVVRSVKGIEILKKVE